ncbi:MAG: AI-2E family transporter [Burkholderiales bacterium]|nr:AI-2E family transporter [Burkholderiales bacterium]
MTDSHLPDRFHAAAALLVGGALLLVLRLHLLPALLAGLMVAELVHILAPRMPLMRAGGQRSKLVVIGLLSIVVSGAVAAAYVGIVALLKSDANSLPALMQKMADILDRARAQFPPWVTQLLPANVEGLREAVSDWLREHAEELQSFGMLFGRALVHVLIGLVIGAMVSLREAHPGGDVGPLAQALLLRLARLGDAFRRVVFAQVRISALNSTLTGIYLLAVLPAIGVDLPLRKTMVVVTFLVGLLPIVGNLVSNTVIFVISLSHSLGAAVGSLAYLIVIHKLEYFVNARIVGSQIRSRAWEVLSAMLAMEAAFGLAGLVAAPIYYAWLKDELASRGWL